MSNSIIKKIRTQSPTLSVSISDSNLLDISGQVKQIEQAGVDILHFSIKDGCFVPFLTFGPDLIKAVNTSLLKDVHLMIHDPAEKIDDYIYAGADILTLHIESDYNLLNTFNRIGEFNNTNDPNREILRGIAMNPDIPVEDLAPFLDTVEMVSILTYNPKAKNGKDDDKLVERVQMIKKMIAYSKKDILLSINGILSKSQVKEISSLNADIIVIGKPIYENNKIKENVQQLNQLIK